MLAVNCGSSSLKLGLYEEDAAVVRIHIERIGTRAKLELRRGAQAGKEEIEAADHGQAFEQAIERMPEIDQARDFQVGHRIVHGGTGLRETTRIDARVIGAIEAQLPLVPLHNGPALEAIRAATKAFGPGVRQIAVFDTHFHRDLPAHAARYAIPLELEEKHDLVRVGFHGLAHRWMSERYAALSRAGTAASVVTLQLGNGCSAAAVRAGRSIDVTMGYSPLEGLVMGTRSGDVDPALVLRLAELEKVDPSVIATWLHTRAGLLGVSGHSQDMRELLEAEKDGDPRSALAVEMFVQRVRKAIGAMLAVLGGADAIVFGGGIGEHAAPIRARVCAGFEWCGLVLDPRANAEASLRETRISAAGARVEAWVVPVDEEALIVREVRGVLAAQREQA
ncbi:MAG: acetate/propionate family kinase [Planctomycetota bacterium]